MPMNSFGSIAFHKDVRQFPVTCKWPCLVNICKGQFGIEYKEVQVGNDQEKAQSERNSHSRNRGGEKLNSQLGTDT